MVSLTNVVLLACACVAIEAQLRQACMKMRKGSTKGFKHFIKPDVLPKNLEYWTKVLPNCPHGKTGGVDVRACDDSKIPKVKFLDSSTVAVNRTGKLDSYIVVIIDLYCSTPQPSSGEILSPL